MSREYLWGCELNSSNKEYVWDMNDDSDDADGSLCYNLLLKQAVLGKEVKNGEVNIVELETVGIMAAPIMQPLLKLKAGQVDQCQLDILVTHPGSRLKLAEGSGPVYLWGQHLVELVDDGFDEENNAEEGNSDSNDDAMDEAEIKEELEFLKGDFEKHVNAESENSKKRRKNPKQERARKDEDEDITDEDDEETEEVKAPAAARKKKSKVGVQVKKSPKETKLKKK